MKLLYREVETPGLHPFARKSSDHVFWFFKSFVEFVTTEILDGMPYDQAAAESFLESKGLIALDPPWGSMLDQISQRSRYVWQGIDFMRTRGLTAYPSLEDLYAEVRKARAEAEARLLAEALEERVPAPQAPTRNRL